MTTETQVPREAMSAEDEYLYMKELLRHPPTDSTETETMEAMECRARPSIESVFFLMGFGYGLIFALCLIAAWSLL